MRYKGFELRGAIVVENEGTVSVLARHIPSDEDVQCFDLTEEEVPGLSIRQIRLLAEVVADAINAAAREEAKATGRKDPI